MSRLKKKVLKAVKLIPSGNVASYGQVALYVGLPRAARQVGWILNGLPEETDIPWWRVVNNSGRISIKASKYTALDQKKLLENEGLIINEDLTFEIEKYRFLPDKKFVEKMELDPYYLEMIASKIPYSK